MRSILWIFGCCLIFAVTLLTGISLQSCKVSKDVSRTEQVDSHYMDAYYRKDDAAQFAALLERFAENFKIEVKEYLPLPDSMGQPTQVYLAKHVQAARNRLKNSVGSSVSAESEQTEEASQTDTHFESEEDVETEREPPYWKYGLAAFVLWAIWIYYRSKE